MKVVKFLLKAILWIAVIVIVALLTIPLWFGPVAKGVANSVVPGIVKTNFHLAHLSLNPYTCRFELSGLKLANPQGYPEEIAASVGELAFDAETASLATDVIHIEEITVKDVFASYVNGGENKVNNFQQIQYNVAGGKEKYEAAQAEKQQAKAGEKSAEAPAAEAQSAESKPEKKVIIDKLTISGIKVQLGLLPIKVPFDITMTDIGKDSGGATLDEVWAQVCAAVMKAAGSVGDAAVKAADAAKGLLNGVASGAATNKATKAVGDAAGKALDSIKKLW